MWLNEGRLLVLTQHFMHTKLPQERVSGNEKPTGIEGTTGNERRRVPLCEAVNPRRGRTMTSIESFGRDGMGKATTRRTSERGSE